MFGYLPESELIAACNFTFQLWDFFVSFTIPEHCTVVMLAHHTLAAFVSWSGLDNQVRPVTLPAAQLRSNCRTIIIV